MNNSFTHGDEVERWRHRVAPAFCCCVSAEPGGIQRRASGLACPLEAPPCVRYVLTAAYTSACGLSACSQGRLAPRPARCWPGRCAAACCRPASGSLRRATPSWTILGASDSARTLVTAHRARPSTRLPRSTVHHCSQCWPSARFCSAYRLRVASAQLRQWQRDGTAARGACVRVRACVRAVTCEGRSSQRFRPRENRAKIDENQRKCEQFCDFSVAARPV